MADFPGAQAFFCTAAKRDWGRVRAALRELGHEGNMRFRAVLRRFALACCILLAVAVPWAARADADANVCRAAIAGAEAGTAIPSRLLSAIAVVESGRRDPATGSVSPWPWTINVEGVGHLYDSKADAIAAVQAFRARGARSIDVGCMQVNLLYHADAFSSLDEAFDPAANARYAARFLLQLYGQAGSWPRATGAYHSWTPELGDDYARKVLAVWDSERDRPADLPPLPHPLTPVASFGSLSGLGRILPMPGQNVAGATQGGGSVGRSLDDYRAAPTRTIGFALGLRRF